MQPNQNPKRQFRNYAIFSGIAVQMGVTIYLGVILGKWLDQKMANEKKYFTILFTFLALVVSIYNIIIQLKKLDEK